MTIGLKNNTFKAWIDEMPPGPAHALFVTGETKPVEIDWKIALVRVVPQGINPTVLELRLDVQKPTGPHSNALASRTLRYEEKPPKEKYKSVHIQNDPDSFSIPVEIVV